MTRSEYERLVAEVERAERQGKEAEARKRADAQRRRAEEEALARAQAERAAEAARLRRNLTYVGAAVLLFFVARSIYSPSRPAAVRQVTPSPTAAERVTEVGSPQAAEAQSVELSIVNKHTRSVSVFKVSNQGTETLITRLAPGESYSERTRAGQRWRVKDSSSGRILRTVDATGTSRTVVVQAPPAQAPKKSGSQTTPTQGTGGPAPSKPAISSRWLVDIKPVSGGADTTDRVATIAGVIYERTISFTWGGWAVYDLGGRYSRFNAYVGIKDNSYEGEWGEYAVLVDGNPVAQGVLRRDEPAVRLDIPVRGARSLKLQTTRTSVLFVAAQILP